MIDYNRALIENLKKYRKHAKVSKTQLAKRCGVHPSTIGNIEAGHTMPSFELMIKISNALNIKMAQLVEVLPEENKFYVGMKIDELCEKLKSQLTENLTETIENFQNKWK